ncbi:MAG: hypothetical protein LBG81_02690 [Coriobacteriaceae bacterium]|jgi:hypothetical protein|nr:hypothetical protein [Coriobacteriaceae bacterium]
MDVDKQVIMTQKQARVCSYNEVMLQPLFRVSDDWVTGRFMMKWVKRTSKRAFSTIISFSSVFMMIVPLLGMAEPVEPKGAGGDASREQTLTDDTVEGSILADVPRVPVTDGQIEEVIGTFDDECNPGFAGDPNYGGWSW